MAKTKKPGAKRPRALSNSQTRAGKIALTDPTTRELATIKSRALKLLDSCRALGEVRDTPSFEQASSLVKDAVSIRKALAATAFATALAEAKADLKTKDALLKSVEKLIRDAETGVRDALEAYAARQRAAQEALVVKALAKGKDEQAASLAAKPFTPDVAGLSFTEHWHAEVESLHALVKAAASDEKLLVYLNADMVELNAMARIQHDAMTIPGVRGVRSTSSTVRS